MKISREKSEGENKQTNRGEKQLKAIRKRKKLIWRVTLNATRKRKKIGLVSEIIPPLKINYNL